MPAVLSARAMQRTLPGGRTIDGRADLYGTGVLLYFLAAGRLPFAGNSVDDAIAWHLEGEPADPATWRADAPEAYRRVCRGLTARRTCERPPDARAALDLLEARSTRARSRRTTIRDAGPGPRSLLDRARVAAVRLTVEELLGGDFDEDAFRAVYDRLNQLELHHFTRDNQDYLAYISLMVNGGIYPADRLWADLDDGSLAGFHQFVTLCDAHQSQMSRGLLAAHREVTANMARQDPTPFKSFRYREFHTTVALMNVLPDDASETDVLAGEIVITGEVADAADMLAAQGVLTFGLSDKPDEASVPSAEAAAAGAVALHHVKMKVIGSLHTV